MLTLQQAVVPHLKVTGTAVGVPTAQWSANYTPHTVVPPCSSILWPPRTHNVLVSGCTHCDVVKPTLQITGIGNRSAIALWSPMCEITADAPVSAVRRQYWSDTRIYKEQWTNKVGQVKKVWCETLQGGDTRVNWIKLRVMSKKGHQFF